MTRFLVLASAALVSAAMMPAPAEAFSGKRNTQVNQVNDAVFEVVARSSSKGQDFWCGASDYARRVLGAGWRDRIYVARGMGPSLTTNRRSAVHFTIDPQAAGIESTDTALSINSFPVGDNMTIQKANTYCSTAPFRL